MLRKTYTCSELCSHLNISIYDLNGIVSEGKLKACNRRYSLIEKDDKGYLYGGAGEEYVLSTGPLGVTDENGFYFLTSDVLAFEKEYGIIPQGPTTDPLQKENLKSTIPVYENAFIHQDDTWEIWFKGRKINPVKNMDGLIYIANLMLNPGKPKHVVDLCNSFNPQQGNAMMDEEDVKKSLKANAMSISTMQDDGLDLKGKEALKQKIKDMYEIIDEPDLPESEREEARTELKKITKSLGIYGKKPLHHRAPKKIHESVKKDLDRAGKAINRAYDKIRKQSPELADYLKNTIKRGTQYCFTDIGTPWQISI